MFHCGVFAILKRLPHKSYVNTSNSTVNGLNPGVPDNIICQFHSPWMKPCKSAIFFVTSRDDVMALDACRRETSDLLAVTFCHQNVSLTLVYFRDSRFNSNYLYSKYIHIYFFIMKILTDFRKTKDTGMDLHLCYIYMLFTGCKDLIGGSCTQGPLSDQGHNFSLSRVSQAGE